MRPTQALPFRDQRPHVLRQAAAAEAAPRLEERGERRPHELPVGRREGSGTARGARPRMTSTTSTSPTAAQRFPISLAKEMRVASRALDAYLIISAVACSRSRTAERRSGTTA